MGTDHVVEGETVTIHGVASSGAGVGRMADGRVVFVHRTAPGDEVRVAITESRARWHRGRLLEVLQPGPDRTIPPCAHFSRCGGCSVQHLRNPAQEVIRTGWVTDALTRIGKFESLPPIEFHRTPNALGYRNRATMTLRRLGRGPLGRALRVVAGFHALERPGHLFDLGAIPEKDPGCLILEPNLRAMWARLRDSWGPHAMLLPAGDTLRLTLRILADGRGLLLVEGGHGPGQAQRLLESVAGLEAVWHRPNNRMAPRLLAGSENLHENWMGESFPIRPGAFLQVNREGAAILHRLVLGALEVAEGDTVVDAYCGMGFYGRSVARRGGTVVGLELDPEAVAMGQSRPCEGFTLKAGAVEELLAEHLPVTRVILNPPRGGVASEVIDALLAAPPRRIVYVSCDPATLARDLARLAPAFALRQIQLVDLFPQTAHVETVVTLDAVTP
jgi:23S rRNA (uracil1939-C5)-methyltransferase